MLKIKAFQGWRPHPELAAKIAALPYDVLNSAEARQMATGNPYSFLHVSKAEIDLPPETNLYDEAVYLKAAANLQAMQRQGWLFQETAPALYIYRLIMQGHTQYGLIACAYVPDYLEGRIKIHELTREAKEQDRIKHVDYTNANTGPVFLTYRAQAEIDAYIKHYTMTNAPAYDFTAEDGIQHTLWVITDRSLIGQLITFFERIPCAYVADGHHRAKSAAMVGKMRAAANPQHRGDEEYNWFLAAFFPHNQLRILDYNRVIRDLNGMNPTEFLQRLTEKFIITPAANRESARPQKARQFGMYLPGQWYNLTCQLELDEQVDLIASLDVSILQNHVLAPLLGITDPRRDERIDFVGGIRGLAELEKRVDSGEMAVAFALYPTSIEQLLAIADAGLIMPPKSTWFEPKLRSGLVIHMLD